MILYLREPRGAETSTISPFLRPMIALPTGDSFESLRSAGFASAEPTISYSTVSFASRSRRRTRVPIATTPFGTSSFSISRARFRRSSSCAIRCSSIACSFFASSYSEFSEMSPNSRACLMRSATSRRLSPVRYSISSLSFCKPSGVSNTSFTAFLRTPETRSRRRCGAESRRILAIESTARGSGPRLPFPPRMQVDLRSPWRIGPVEIPTRVVLAPMAGVSVQAFRRQGRRYGAGLVCSEMVSCAGLSHGNERTLGYLRIAGDEHPLAVQIFGSEPGLMAEAARLVAAAGADLVDINFGCPVKKVTKTGAGATLLEDPERACRIVDAVVRAVHVRSEERRVGKECRSRWSPYH